MPRLSATVDQAVKEGVEQIAKQYQMNQSEAIRIGMQRMIQDFEEDVPEWVFREAVHERLKTEGNPYLRMMHFKQRVHEYFRNCLLDDRGKIKQYPPEPEKVESVYVEQVMKEVRQEYPEYEEEYTKHVRECMDWYSLMHPDTPTGDKRAQAVSHIVLYLRYDREEKAQAVASEASVDVSESPTQLMEVARESMKGGDWRHKWDRAVGGGLHK